MSHCNTDKFNYFLICEPLARCAKRGSSLPLGTPIEIDFTCAHLHYPLPQCSKIVTPIIFSISYELFRLPSAKVPQDYKLLRTFVWKSWPGTMGHFLIRKSHFRGLKFQNFPGEHAPGAPRWVCLRRPVCLNSPFRNPGSTPVLQNG